VGAGEGGSDGAKGSCSPRRHRRSFPLFFLFFFFLLSFFLFCFFLFFFFLFVRGACVAEPFLPTVGIAKRGTAM
jgi:hypothetical protein